MSNNTLKQIIKEELLKVLKESSYKDESIEESRFPETAEEYAKQINKDAEARRTSPDDWGGKLVTDQEYWARSGVRTGEELAHYLAAETHNDMYKSIHGIRPRINYKKLSVDEIEKMIDDLSKNEEPFNYGDEPEETEYKEPDFSFGTLKDLLRKDK